MDDLPKHIKIKREFNYGGNVAEQIIVDLGPGEIILHPGKHAADQQKEGEIPEPALVRGEEKDRQACQKGDRGGD